MSTPALTLIEECLNARYLALIEPCPDCAHGAYAIYYERSGLVCMAHQPDLESARRFACELGLEFVEAAEREVAAIERATRDDRRDGRIAGGMQCT